METADTDRFPINYECKDEGKNVSLETLRKHIQIVWDLEILTNGIFL